MDTMRQGTPLPFLSLFFCTLLSSSVVHDLTSPATGIGRPLPLFLGFVILVSVDLVLHYMLLHAFPTLTCCHAVLTTIKTNISYVQSELFRLCDQAADPSSMACTGKKLVYRSTTGQCAPSLEPSRCSNGMPLRSHVTWAGRFPCTDEIQGIRTPGDRSPLSSLEIPLSAPPQCLIIKETRTGWSSYFCPCWIAVLGIFHGCLGIRLEDQVVLHQKPQYFCLRQIWHCSIWCLPKIEEIGLVRFASHGSWDGGDQATPGPHPGAERW
jgi:hypothetical protein